MERTNWITGHTVANYVINPFLVWCDFFAPKEEKDQKSAYLDVLFKRGIAHEDEVRRELFPTAVLVQRGSMEAGFEAVMKLAQEGAEVIANGPLLIATEQLIGVPDILEKREGQSRFGSYYYIVREVKSAKWIKKEHVLQAAFYNYVLGKIQGYTPVLFYLVNRDKTTSEHFYEEYEKELMDCLKNIREISAGKSVAPTGKDCKWPWESYGLKKALEVQDISLLQNVGKEVRSTLIAHGVRTIESLAKEIPKVNIPQATLGKIQRAAQVWLTKKPMVLQKPSFESQPVELYVDFEGTDEQEGKEGFVKTDYLIGVLIKKEGKEKFIPLIAESPKDEETLFVSFLSLVSEFPSAPIYHYGSYEKTHIRALGKKYGKETGGVEQRMVDVLFVLKKCVVLPTISLRLKEVGKFLGCTWRNTASAQDSLALYGQFMETKDKRVLQQIIDYNEDDVVATKKVKEFLESLEK